MKKPAWTKQRQHRVQRFFVYWLQEFGFLPLLVDFRFEERNEQTKYAAGDASCRIEFGYPYRQLTIVCFPCVARYTIRKLTMMVLHELLHIALARLKGNRTTNDKDVWARLEEEAVDLIAMVMTNHLRELRRP